MESLGNKARLIPFHTTISFPFNPENLFGDNNIHIGLIRNQGPCPITKKCIEFLRHGLSSNFKLHS
jgi:hypothetical protein